MKDLLSILELRLFLLLFALSALDEFVTIHGMWYEPNIAAIPVVTRIVAFLTACVTIHEQFATCAFENWLSGLKR